MRESEGGKVICFGKKRMWSIVIDDYLNGKIHQIGGVIVLDYNYKLRIWFSFLFYTFLETICLKKERENYVLGVDGPPN